MSTPIYLEVSRHHRFLSVRWKQWSGLSCLKVLCQGERDHEYKNLQKLGTKKTGGVIIICSIQLEIWFLFLSEMHFDAPESMFGVLGLAPHLPSLQTLTIQQLSPHFADETWKFEMWNIKTFLKVQQVESDPGTNLCTHLRPPDKFFEEDYAIKWDKMLYDKDHHFR